MQSRLEVARGPNLPFQHTHEPSSPLHIAPPVQGIFPTAKIVDKLEVSFLQHNTHH